MTKEKPQLKNPEPQALKMARESLRRIKEMEFTDEEKEKVMAMIDEAKAAENEGNKSKAFNLYEQLRKYLEGIKSKAEGEVADDPEKIKRQLAKIEEEIKKLEEMDDDIAENVFPERDLLLAALKRQKETVAKSVTDKTTLLRPDHKVEIKSKTIFAEKDIWDQIIIQENLDEDDLFLQQKIFDKERRLIYLGLGVINKPQVLYSYSLAGDFAGISQGSRTAINKEDINLQDEKTDFARIIAIFKENVGFWDEKIN